MAMMHAWKYSLPAFLVPFLFSASAVGANLLIVESDWLGFLHATLNSGLALFFIAVGFIGYFRGSLSIIERALLVASALFMVVFPVGFSLQGSIPVVVSALLMGRHLFMKAPVTEDIIRPAP